MLEGSTLPSLLSPAVNVYRLVVSSAELKVMCNCSEFSVINSDAEGFLVLVDNLENLRKNVISNILSLEDWIHYFF